METDIAMADIAVGMVSSQEVGGSESIYPREEVSGRLEFSLPQADGGRDAWLFLAACFVVEALVWGEYYTLQSVSFSITENILLSQQVVPKLFYVMTFHDSNILSFRVPFLLRYLSRILQYT
jgi:hypothetical protein